MTSPSEWPLPWALTKEENLILATGALLGVVLVGGVIIAKADRWRKRQMDGREDGTAGLGSFREMYETGELSKEEYDRVLRRIAERAGVKVKPATPPDPGPTPPTTDDQNPPAAPPG